LSVVGDRLSVFALRFNRDNARSAINGQPTTREAQNKTARGNAGRFDQYPVRRSSASFRNTFFRAAIAFLLRFMLGFS
jgi:hypothetical protein